MRRLLVSLACVSIYVRAHAAIDMSTELQGMPSIVHKLSVDNFDSSVLESFKRSKDELKKGWLIMMTQSNDCLSCKYEEAAFAEFVNEHP